MVKGPSLQAVANLCINVHTWRHTHLGTWCLLTFLIHIGKSHKANLTAVEPVENFSHSFFMQIGGLPSDGFSSENKKKIPSLIILRMIWICSILLIFPGANQR